MEKQETQYLTLAVKKELQGETEETAQQQQRGGAEEEEEADPAVAY
jgi:hypothetical protein